MSVDKRVNYDVQGGVKNYLGKQKEVKAPLKWQSSPDHPTTELAYITEAEKDLLVKSDLHGSLKGGVNRGPSGIMSLNGYGSIDSSGRDVGMSGAATSAAESGGGSGADARELASESQRVRSGPDLSPGVVDQNVQDYRNAFIAAGGGQRVNPGFFDGRNTVSPAELARAKAFAPQAYKTNRSRGVMDYITGGGILGAGVRSLGQMFGLGKKYNEPTYDMSKYNQLGYYPDRVKGYTRPEGYEFLDNEEQAAIDLELFNKGMYTDDYKNMYGLGMDDTGGITTIPTGDGDKYTQNVVETINETVDDNIPDEDLLLRYLGDASTLNPEAAGVNSVADLRNLQLERAKNLYT